jgi:hypothetical protein
VNRTSRGILGKIQVGSDVAVKPTAIVELP